MRTQASSAGGAGWAIVCCVGFVFGFFGPAWAAEPSAGQPDLDAAIEKKLSIEKGSELQEVVDLCKSALDKGLDEENAAFARRLAASSLYERAEYYCRPIFDKKPPSPLWRQLRKLAQADLEASLEFHKDFGPAEFLLARLELLPEGDRDKAVTLVNRAIEHLGDAADVKSKALMLRAGLSEDPEKRMADLAAAIQTDSNNADAYKMRGLLMLREEKLEEALGDLAKVVELNADDVGALEAYAETLIQLERFDEALNQLSDFVVKNPGSVPALILRARVLALKEKVDEAIESLDKALAIDERNVVALLLRSRLRFIAAQSPPREQGNLEDAMKDVDRALQLQPGLAQAVLLKAQLLATTGDYAEAITLMKRLATANSGNEELQRTLAGFYMADGQFDRAIKVYEELLSRDPRDFEALRGRADALLNQGRHKEALADYEAAVKIKKDDRTLLNNLAWVLATSPEKDLRNGERAIQLATKACELSEYKAAHILSTLAASYAETGDFEKAREYATKAVELADAEDLTQIKQELESYQADKPWRERKEPEAPKEDAPSPDDLNLEEGLEID